MTAGSHRFVFDPSLFPVGKYRLTVVFGVAEDGVVYLRVYEVRSRERVGGWPGSGRRSRGPEAPSDLLTPR